ncbi:MAG TPA: lipopolysaccharide biosynthesis [Cyanobacteria bacterium UBA8803]|nr:lipopolysaccharide biosynthesis [Cyanobacteria bacterium UBA9273]HBL62816.1 lipopolysaccharide biosynthesis [Cyanobacteria bacterium UBA8803]
MTPPLVKRYIIALDRHKLMGMAVFGLITAISGAVALIPSTPTPVSYEVLGVLGVTTPPKVFSQTGVQIQEQGLKITPEMLLADNVLKATATVVGVNPKDIKDNVEVLQKKGSGKGSSKGDEGDQLSPIGVKYKASNDPEKAAKIVEVLMQKMIEQSRLVNGERLRTIIEAIEKRSVEAKADLQKAEQQLERYDRIEGAALAAAKDEGLLGAISSSQQNQRQLQLTLEGVDSQIASLERRLGLTADQAYTNSALSADPIIAGLRAQIQEADTQLTLLRSQGYRDAHPQVAQILQQQKTYEKMLGERATEVIGGNGLGEPLTPIKVRQDSNLDPARMQLANTLVGLQTQRDTLKEQLQSTKRIEKELLQQYQKIPSKRLERMRLAQQFEIKQQFYTTLQASLIDAKAAELEVTSNLSIAQPPQVTKSGGEAQGTNPVVVLAGGTFLGLVLAAGSILLLAILDNTLYSPQEIRQVLAQQDVRVLGELPFVVSLDPDLGETGILLKPDSHYLDIYERFRSSLRRGENKSLKVVAIASTIEGEGKTVTAYNLAIASAQAGKRTLLVEADFRGASQSQFLKVIPEPSAKVEPLRYYSSISRCVKLAPNIENLYIVASPGPQRQAAAFVESSELQRLIADARGRFDFVIVDTPSLSRWDDALLLEPLTDGLILVTRPGLTQKGILNQATQELTEAESVRLLGAVINGVDGAVPVTPVEDGETEDYEEEESFEEEDLEEDEPVPTGVMGF